MKYAIGYPLPVTGSASVVDIVREFSTHVAEVYFAWPGVASGRAPFPPEQQARLEADVVALRGMGVRLNVLFNASCYGAQAFSRAWALEVATVIDRIDALAGVNVVTTMSPLVAKLVKERYRHIAVRASVNMRVGTIRAMEQLGGLFDGLVVQRDHNRHLDRLRELKAWCTDHGKSLQLLANSGCLSWCAVQTFHDNLVSHEGEIDAMECVAPTIPGGCWEHYGQRTAWVDFLRNTWVRPEDIHHYEGLVDEVKLATRMHATCRRVVRAYAEQRYVGNLADLLEPGHSRLFAPHVFDNQRFPADWFERITEGASSADEEAYCRSVLSRVCVDTRGEGGVT